MKLQKAADRVIAVLGLALFGVLTGFSLFFTSYFALTYEEIPYQMTDLLPLVLALSGIAVWILHLITGWMLNGEERRQERRIRILLGLVLVCALAFGVWWVRAAKCIPLGDQASVCTAAEQFRNGDFSMLTDKSYERYLYIHPHQLGLTALTELIFLVFGNGNYMAFEYLNCLGVCVILYTGYRILGLLTEDRRARVFYLFLGAACFPLLFYVTFVYGEIPSMTFSGLALWCFLEYQMQREEKGKKWIWLLLCAATCALACLIRNNCMILLMAMGLILATTALSERRLQPLLAAVLLVVVFAGARTGLRTFYEQRSGVAINDGAPMILYVAMGMQKGEGAPGWSNGYILHNYWGASDFDAEASTAMAVQDIRTSAKEFVDNPGYAFRFYVEKFTSQWNDPTYECFAMTHINGEARGPVANSMFDGKLHALMCWFMNVYQTLIYGGVFLWVLQGFWKKKDLSVYILLVSVFGGFLFHMLWEAKGRYILPYFILMLPMAAAGLSETARRAQVWIERKGILRKEE